MVDEEPDLPEELWLFNRLFEWSRSDWQYYGCTPGHSFQRILAGVARFGLDNIETKMREGKRLSEDPELSTASEDWLAAHAEEIAASAFRIAERRRDFLATNKGNPD